VPPASEIAAVVVGPVAAEPTGAVTIGPEAAG